MEHQIRESFKSKWGIWTWRSEMFCMSSIPEFINLTDIIDISAKQLNEKIFTPLLYRSIDSNILSEHL